MKLLKRSLIVITLFVAAALVWLLFFFDANQFKPEIEQAAFDQTGRKLVIAGDIDLALWPPVSLNISNVEFENADGFGDQPMAKLGRLQLVTDLFALLDNRLEVKRLNVENVDLRLQKNAAGKSNWEDLSNRPAEEPEAEAANDEGVSSSEAPAFSVAGINVSGVNLVYQDQQAQQFIEIKGLDLSAGEVRENLPVAIKLSLGLVLNEPKVQLNLQAEAETTWNPTEQTLSVKGTEIALNATGDALPNGAITSQINADLEVNLEKQALAMSNGQISLDENQASLAAQLNWGENPLRASLVVGAERIDLSAYQQESSATGAADEQKNESEGATDINVIEVPTDWLALFNGHIDLTIKELISNKLTAKNTKLFAMVEDKKLNIASAKTEVFDGVIDATGGFSAAGLGLNLAVKHLDAAKAQQAFLDGAYADGKVNLESVSLNSRGKTVGEMRQNLNGAGAMRVNDAAVHGVNVVAWVKNIQALLKGADLSVLTETQDSAGTDFAEITATFKITNGVLDNRDLLAKSPGARIKGYGWVNLANETLDYFMVPTIVETSQGQGGENRDDLKGVDVPRRCKGPWADMDCRFEIERAVKDKAKAKAKEKVSEKLEEKLGDKVPKGLLDGLFN